MAEEVDPVSQKDDGNGKHTIAYGANDIDSLESLELSCERDEAHLFAKIKEIRLAKDDDMNVTAVIYEDADDLDMGELTFEQFKTDVDESSLRAIHKSLGEPVKGRAFISGQI